MKEEPVKEEAKTNEKVIVEEKVESPIVEVTPDQEDELGKTIEFTEYPKKVTEEKATPTDLKKESTSLKEVEDLFDDE